MTSVQKRRSKSRGKCVSMRNVHVSRFWISKHFACHLIPVMGRIFARFENKGFYITISISTARAERCLIFMSLSFQLLKSTIYDMKSFSYRVGSLNKTVWWLILHWRACFDLWRQNVAGCESPTLHPPIPAQWKWKPHLRSHHWNRYRCYHLHKADLQILIFWHEIYIRKKYRP